MAARRLLPFLLPLLLAFSVQAQPQPTEYDVKAVFLYNFARFAEWPEQEEDRSALRICVLGDAPFGEAFDEVLGRPVRKRTIEVRRLSTITPDDTCDVLFVSPVDKQRLRKILQSVAGRPILTVGDGEEFVRAGGAIAFVVRDKKVRFLVHPAAAEAVGIRLSSRLLRVAEIYGAQD